MSVINSFAGPLVADTAIVPTDERQILVNVLMELRAIRIILSNAYGVTDDTAGLRNSMTVNDLTHVG